MQVYDGAVEREALEEKNLSQEARGRPTVDKWRLDAIKQGFDLGHQE